MGGPAAFFGHAMMTPRLRFLAAALSAAALAVCLGATPASASGGGGEGGGKGGGQTTAFGPEERKLQLSPLWVPVIGARSQTKGVPGYRPVTIMITSREHGMMTMCYRLPYIVEALLFEMNRQPISQNRGRMDFTGLNARLFAVADRAAGPSVVKSVEAVENVPRPDKANQDMLALCQ